MEFMKEFRFKEVNREDWQALSDENEGLDKESLDYIKSLPEGGLPFDCPFARISGGVKVIYQNKPLKYMA